jgi:RimJ/RimL family protein N-acetyltransferase
MNLQPTLTGNLLICQPLQESDFEVLFEAANDPLIWEQHPDKNRWQKDVFKTNFFDGAITSKGAFLIIDSKSKEVIGSSRYYDWDEKTKEITIGFTFLKRSHWGGVFNKELKELMLAYAFMFAETVLLVIGDNNIRSQKAAEKIGAKLREKKGDKLIFSISKS